MKTSLLEHLSGMLPILGAGLMAVSLAHTAPATQQESQILRASDGSPRDAFSASLAISGDTAVVGAPEDSSAASFNGAAYVFARDAGSWSGQAKLLASDASDFDAFGRSVAVDGETILVGAVFAAGGRASTGAAYVFTRAADGSWAEQDKLHPSSGTADDQFGTSVAVSGDTAVIGGRVGGGGVAFVYELGASGTWTEQARLVAGDGASLATVAISGDTVVAGAPLDDVNGYRSGAAYVFTRGADGSWSEQAKLVASDGAPEDGFGSQLAISGDSVLIAAESDDDNGRESGSAYVFTRGPGGSWTEQAKLLPSDGTELDVFGISLDLSDDTAIVGAFFDDDNGEDSGSAYVFTRNPAGLWSERAKLLASDGASGDLFGNAVAVDGDTAIVGTFYNYYDRRESGSAYVFGLGTPAGAAALLCPGDITGDGVAELVLVSGADVRIKDLNGAEINTFGLGAMRSVVDVELLPDSNGNSAPELVALGGDPVAAEVRDLLTGGNLGTVTFDADLAPVDLALVEAPLAMGMPALAGLGRDPATVEVRDALGGNLIHEMDLARYLTGTSLAMYPDLDGDGVSELGILADNRRPDAADKVEIRNPVSGALIREIWLGRHWGVLEQALISDLNGNGSEEVAVLRVHPDGRVNVQIRDTLTREWVSFVGFAVKYPPMALISIPDMDGNGADELVVFGRHADGSQKAVIKDSRTRAKLGELWFDRAFPALDFVHCGDLDGNGAADLALVGQHARDGRLKVIVRDSRTGERLGMVWF